MSFASPTASETLCAGRSHTVRWNLNGSSEPRVRIRLLTWARTPVPAVNVVVANSGSWLWTVPEAIAADRHMLIIEPPLQDPEMPRVLAESPVFRIHHCYDSPPSLRYDGPNLVEVCGGLATIVWSSRGAGIRNVRIQFMARSLPGGIFTLAESTANTSPARLRLPAGLIGGVREHLRVLGTLRIESAEDPDIFCTWDMSFIRCPPTNEQLAQDIVLNPVDQLFLLTTLGRDPTCQSCVEFDLGKIKAALGDPSRPLGMVLLHAGRMVADLGVIGGGKAPPDRIRRELAPDLYKLFSESPTNFAIVLKTMDGKEAAKVKTEVILDK